MTSPTPSSEYMNQRLKVVSRYCFACRTPWVLTVERHESRWIILCKECGTHRAPLTAG